MKISTSQVQMHDGKQVGVLNVDDFQCSFFLEGDTPSDAEWARAFQSVVRWLRNGRIIGG